MFSREAFAKSIQAADSSWHAILWRALDAVEEHSPGYLDTLNRQIYLPTQNRIFAAFSVPLTEVRFVLVGEGPYPREESANGYCFMDAAVGSLWSFTHGGGLSKSVNRATSLRNFIKMLIVAEGWLPWNETGADQLGDVVLKAAEFESPLVQTMEDLHKNFLRSGFLMLNASLIFREGTAPAYDAKAWLPFLQVIFSELAIANFNCESRHNSLLLPTVLLWGKIADRLALVDSLAQFPNIKSEHPYNLSFIRNEAMQDFFRPLKLLFR